MIELSKFKLTGHRVLIKFTEAEKIRGGIHVPESAKDRRKNGREAIVVMTGTSDKPFLMAAGDRVIVHQHSGALVEIQDQKLHIVRPEEDILAIVTKAA